MTIFSFLSKSSTFMKYCLFTIMFLVIINGDITNAGGIIAFFITSLIPIKIGPFLPKHVLFFLFILALINACSWLYFLYTNFSLFDEITHTYTTFMLTLAIGVFLLQKLPDVYITHRYFFLITVLCFGIAIGAQWEIYEWIADFFVQKNLMENVADTITDLILDSTGALGAIVILSYLRKIKRVSQIIKKQEV